MPYPFQPSTPVNCPNVYFESTNQRTLIATTPNNQPPFIATFFCFGQIGLPVGNSYQT